MLLDQLVRLGIKFPYILSTFILFNEAGFGIYPSHLEPTLPVKCRRAACGCESPAFEGWKGNYCNHFLWYFPHELFDVTGFSCFPAETEEENRCLFPILDGNAQLGFPWTTSLLSAKESEKLCFIRNFKCKSWSMNRVSNLPQEQWEIS